VNNGAAFVRYARALLVVAERESDPDRVGDELDTYVQLLADHPELARVLQTPMVPPARKADAVRALAEHAGFIPLVARLLAALAERDRLATVPHLAKAFRARLLERRNIVAAEVTSAVPLPSDKTAAIAERLGEVTGKRVQVSASVDPSIIGGVVARVGSLVYDGSVANQLARMRQKLVENV
jgi:F-type H+-transporting ATPase subunit delta